MKRSLLVDPVAPSRPDLSHPMRVRSAAGSVIATPAYPVDTDPPLPPVEDGRSRVARLWALLQRPVGSSGLLHLADSLVLLGYLAAVPTYWKLLGGLWLLTVLSMRAAGLYQPRLNLSLLDDLPRMLRGFVASDLFLAVVVGRLHGTASLGFFATVAGAGALGHVVVRGLAYYSIHRARRGASLNGRTIVVGGGEISQRLVGVLDAEPSFGLRVVGYVDDIPSRHGGSDGWNYLGEVDDLPALMQRLDVPVLVVGFLHARDLAFSQLMRSTRIRPKAVYVVPRMFEIGRRTTAADHIGVIPILRLSTAPVNGIQVWPKRVFDVVGASVFLALLSPLLLLTALAVRLDGGAGVIFRQQRVGRDGRLFDVFKFRSMSPVDATEGDTLWSIGSDQRVSSFGRFLRRSSIDELPQLVNILRGDMTFVGPRPERPHFVEQFTAELPHYQHRHRVQVGLTGLAQVNGLRGDTSIDDRARFDNHYIENWSLWLDIKVVLRTASQVAFGRGR